MDPFLEQLHTEQREREVEAPARREQLVEYGAVVLLVAVCAAMWFLGPRSEVPHDVGTIVALVVAYAACWQVTFSIGFGMTTPLQIAFVPMWFAIEPALLPLVVALGQAFGYAIATLRSREEHHLGRTFIAVADAWYAVGPALVLMAFAPGPPSLSDVPIYVVVLGAQFFADGASGAIRTWAVVGVRPRSQLAMAGWMWTVDAALAPMGLILALAVASSAWAVLAAAPLVWLFGQFAKERDDRIRKALELSHAYRGTAQLMGDVLEADDAYTGGEHTQGVVELSLAVGVDLGLSPQQMRDLEFGALLHDIGKLRVPNEIINKPGKLTEEEWAIIKLHPGFGQEMLDRVGGALGEAGLIVRSHHERWDGAGYPDGLVAGAIPIEARIITVCDSFSAMTTNRAYRRGMAYDDAIAELERCSGTQFDPAIVPALRRVLAAAPQRPVVVEAPERSTVSAPASDHKKSEAA